MNTETPNPPSFLKSFSRSQVSSFLSSVADYSVLFLMTEVFQIWYVLATAVGALVGAITNFLLNRHWSFEAGHHDLAQQARKYTVVSGGSLLLNTGGVYLVTEYFQVHYAISVAAVSLLVGFFFNYPLHRVYVYRHQPQQEKV